MKSKLLLFSAMVLSAHSTGFAQTSGVGVEENRLDTIIVTAQRKSQTILEVPVAVQAFDEAAMEGQGIDDVIDLNLASPSFFMNDLQERTANTPVRIRGIGTVGSNAGFEGAVGIYIDDVYRSRAGMALGTFTDIGSLEVLRGPQGTLFGKNTSAGALVINSNKPDFEGISAEVGVTLGNYDSQRYHGYFNVPFGEKAAFRASALVDRSDGFYTDPITGENNQPTETESYRLQLAFEPTDRLRGRISADYTEASGPYGYGRSTRIDNSDLDGSQNGLFGPAALNLIPGAEGGSGYWYWDLANGGDADPFAREVSINRQNENDVADQGIALVLDYDISDNMTLRSITSKRGFIDDNVGADWDFGPLDFAGELSLEYDFDSFSQEVLLTGEQELSGSSSLDYTLGVNYFQEDFKFNRFATVGEQFGDVYSLVLGGLPPNVLGDPSVTLADQDSASDEESLGVFGHATYNINDQLSLVGGLRYNNIQKRVTSINSAADGTLQGYYDSILAGGQFFYLIGGAALSGVDFDETIDNEELTYSAAVQYRPTPDMQLYASYNRGFKAGGVNIGPDAAGGAPSVSGTNLIEVAPGDIRTFTEFTPDNVTFEPEFVDAFELGFKWEYAGAGRLSATAFRAEYDDLQVSIFNGQTFDVLNAGTSLTQGVELENTYSVSDHLTLHGALTWLETAEFGDDVSPLLAAGRRRGQAPKLALSVGGSYDRPVSEDIDVYLNANFAYNSQMFLNDGVDLADVETGAYGVVGGSIGLRDLGNWDISGFCRNCLDEEYFTYAFNQPFVAGGSAMINTNDPMTYGVKLTKGF